MTMKLLTVTFFALAVLFTLTIFLQGLARMSRAFHDTYSGPVASKGELVFVSVLWSIWYAHTLFL